VFADKFHRAIETGFSALLYGDDVVRVDREFVRVFFQPFINTKAHPLSKFTLVVHFTANDFSLYHIWSPQKNEACAPGGYPPAQNGGDAHALGGSKGPPTQTLEGDRTLTHIHINAGLKPD
jgi:hypothetical protein